MEATLYKILTPVMLIGGGVFRAVIKAFDMRQYDSYHSRKRVFIGYEILRQKELNHSISCQSISYEVIFISILKKL